MLRNKIIEKIFMTIIKVLYAESTVMQGKSYAKKRQLYVENSVQILK